MLETIKPIDLFVGEANNGHAELVEAGLRENRLINNLYRGRNDTETLALVRRPSIGYRDTTKAASLILLDCGLPPVGGVGVLRALKRNRRYRWIPVIMMTTAYNPQQAEQCRRLGCEAYVTKWTVFLGLPSFVRRISFLADRTLRIAPRHSTVGRDHGWCAGTLDVRSLPGGPRTHRDIQKRIGKEVKDEAPAP